jgi:hypothetical protein
MSRAAHATPLTSRHPRSGAVLRPPAPRQRVPSLRARPRTDAELRAGHRRATPADRLHLGSLIDSRRGRGREVRCLAAGDLRLHPPLSPSRCSTKAESRATPQGRERAARLRGLLTLASSRNHVSPARSAGRRRAGTRQAWLAPSLSPSVLPSSGLRVLSDGPLRSRVCRFETSTATSSSVASRVPRARGRASGRRSGHGGAAVSAAPAPVSSRASAISDKGGQAGRHHRSLVDSRLVARPGTGADAVHSQIASFPGRETAVHHQFMVAGYDRPLRAR